MRSKWAPKGRSTGRAGRGVARPVLLLVTLALGCAACSSDAPDRGGEPREPVEVRTDPTLALALLRGGAAVVRERGARESDGELRLEPPEGDATAVVWAPGGRALYVAAGLVVWRLALNGAEAVRVCEVADEANDAVARLETSVDGGALLAVTANRMGPNRFADSRHWAIEIASSRVREISARDFEVRAGLVGRYTSARDVALVDASGRWRLRIAAATAEASEALVVEPTTGGAAREVAAIGRLPVDVLDGGRYTGAFNDVGWAGRTQWVVFVAQAECEDVCTGPLFAVAAAGGAPRPLATGVSRVPTEWNGTECAFAELSDGVERVVLADVETGQRTDLGPGSSPRWRPE